MALSLSAVRKNVISPCGLRSEGLALIPRRRDIYKPPSGGGGAGNKFLRREGSLRGSYSIPSVARHYKIRTDLFAAFLIAIKSTA